jgi:hypothetical protein
MQEQLAIMLLIALFLNSWMSFICSQDSSFDGLSGSPHDFGNPNNTQLSINALSVSLYFSFLFLPNVNIVSIR